VAPDGSVKILIAYWSLEVKICVRTFIIVLYHGNEFDKSAKNSRRIWALAREVTGQNKKCTSGIGDIEKCHSETDKATAFKHSMQI
jgi:hypothetical protein